MITHAQIPLVDQKNNEILRIYFSSRDIENRSHPTYIEVEANDPQNITYIHDEPILQLGKLGTFDDNGIMLSWIVNYKNKKFLYYTGWNIEQKVTYRLSIGLAISIDNGKTFQKYSDGPIFDRSFADPYWIAMPCVIREEGAWKMWYISCSRWKIINNIPEPFYNIKYTESKDGIHWSGEKLNCVNHDKFADAFGRPCVYKEKELYKMIYSYRNAINYRTDSKQSYRLGYAESKDGISWKRMDYEIGIDRSKKGWDSKMMEYCYFFDYQGTKYLFYNGNEFGKSGLGYALLQSRSHL